MLLGGRRRVVASETVTLVAFGPRLPGTRRRADGVALTPYAVSGSGGVGRWAGSWSGSTGGGMRVCASTLFAEGAPLTAVAGHLGDTVETVSRTYVHWLRDDRDVLAEVLDRALAPAATDDGRILLSAD